ncbi:MFS transporter [Virgisporangium aurantiacum]|nr:MFS transporter [Virgisporangium aurantiacum]
MSETVADERLPVAYRRLWGASVVSSVGDGAFVAAVPLLAVTITRDPRLVSLVAAATYLPWLLLSLPIGALVDRHERVGLMWRSQAAQATVVAVIAVLALTGTANIPLLVALVFLLGTGEVLFGNAAQAVLPDIVPKALLHKANGLQSAATTVGQLFVGPPVGSVLFAVAVALPFGVDAVSFALSAALLATLPRRRHAAPRVPIRTAIVDGLRWLRRHRLLRTLAWLLGVNNFCFQLGNVTLVLLATQTLGLSARGYGLLLAGAALGSVLGGLANARIIARVGPRAALLAALVTSVVVFLAIGAAPNAVVLAALLAVNGFMITMWNIVTVSLRQEIVPAGLLGRVNSIYRMVGWGLIPLGALAGGFIAYRFGLRAGYPVAGVLRGIALCLALPVLRTAAPGR